MTNWNKHGLPFTVRPTLIKDCKNFLEGLSRDKDGNSLWEINDNGEIWPISSLLPPEDYFVDYKQIIEFLKKNKTNIESGYSFSYADEEFENRSVGGFNSNDNDIKFIKINGDGLVMVK